MSQRHSKKLKLLALVGSVLFGLVLVWGLCFKFGMGDLIAFNYSQLLELSTKERLLLDVVPFRIEAYNTGNPILEMALNALVMAPFGVFLNVIDNKKRVFIKHLLIVFCISLTFEAVQFCTLIGGFATDDLILNTLGYVIGWAIYHLIIKRLPDKVNVILFVILDVIMVAILIYATISIIEIWDLLVKILSTNHFEAIPWQ